MSEELSGLELRKAALKASSIPIWRNPLRRPNGEEGEVGPPCESSIAAAWPLLERWRDKTAGAIQLWIAPNIHGTWRAGCSFNSGEVVGGADLADCASIESAIATAICRALVAAAEKEHG